MNVKNYTKSYHSRTQNLPEKNLVKKIHSLSQEIYKKTDTADRLLKRAQREYYVRELVRRDEITQI